VRSYEKAMAGDPFADHLPDEPARPSGSPERDEREYVVAYFDFLKVVRALAARCVAGGDRRRAENVARFAARAACPPSLLAHLPDRARAADARAASVELAACGGALWREAVRARNETLATLGEGDRAEDEGKEGFFLDAAPAGGGGDDDAEETERATTLAETLADGVAGAGLQGDALTEAEEEDLAAMLQSHRASLAEREDPLENLSDEEATAEATRDGTR